MGLLAQNLIGKGMARYEGGSRYDVPDDDDDYGDVDERMLHMAGLDLD